MCRFCAYTQVCVRAHMKNFMHTRTHHASRCRHVPSLRDYAFFLYYVRRDYTAAENMFIRALEESPEEIDVLSAYVFGMLDMIHALPLCTYMFI